MRKNNNLVKVILTFLLVFTFLLIPYAVEKLILYVSGYDFNTRIMLPKEAWFGFIASYIGAIGTIILGIIAIWQNKRYKKLSDDSSKEVMEIQGELKNLNKRIVDAIETLENIEVAVYTPAIQELLHYYHNVRKETLDDNSDSCAYQINRINIFEDNSLMPLEELMEKYSTFAFTIRNIGEKPIRNFTCREITLNGASPNYIQYSFTDIMSGEIANIIFANLNFDEGDNYLELYFEFNTLLLERYCFNVDILIRIDNDSYDSHVYSFEDPRKIEDNNEDT